MLKMGTLCVPAWTALSIGMGLALLVSSPSTVTSAPTNDEWNENCLGGFVFESGTCRLPKKGEDCIPDVGCGYGLDCAQRRICDQFCVSSEQEFIKNPAMAMNHSIGSESSLARKKRSTSSYYCVCASTKFFEDPHCKDRLAHGTECNPTLKPCVSGFSCVKDRGGQTDKCLCANIQSQYLSGSKCLSMTALKVSPTVGPRTTHSISLHWAVPTSLPSTGNNYYKIHVENAVAGQFPKTIGQGQASQTVVSLPTPGSSYSLWVQSVLPRDSNYPERTTDSEKVSGWTHPAKPGELIEEKSSLHASPYSVTFALSEGQVSYYLFTIDPAAANGQTVYNVTGPVVSSLRLVPDTTYHYRIIGFNGNADRSEAREGSFTTAPSPSGPVNIVSVTTGEDSASITWKRPDNPNGNLTGYRIEVERKDTASCLYRLLVQCGTCSTASQTVGCETRPIDDYKSDDLSVLGELTVNLPSLDPYIEYTARIAPFNVKGRGDESSTDFHTQIGAPEVVQSIVLTSETSADNETASLSVVWTPGKFTGPTDFTLKIEKETATNSGQFEQAISPILQGYTSNGYLESQVLAYWNYKVGVKATTAKGSSLFAYRTTRTAAAKPGKIGVRVEQDAIIAAKVNLALQCPPMTERNGRDWRFEIERHPKFSSQESWLVDAGSCSKEYVASDTDVTVGSTYIYNVRFVNHLFSGDFQGTLPVILSSKAPELPTDDDVIHSPSDSPELKKDSVAVVIAVDDLTKIEREQGAISLMALIVCTKVTKDSCRNGLPARSKRSLSENEVTSYYTWRQAVSQGFEVPYRATPQDWHTEVLNDAGQSFTYDVGADADCPPDPNSYCNGPLPHGKEFVMYLVVCNAAGCIVYEADGVYKTAVETATTDESDVHIGVIIGAVIAGVVILALVAVLILLLCIRRRGDPQTKVPWPGTIDVPTKKSPFKTEVAGNEYDIAGKVPGPEYANNGKVESEYTYANPGKVESEYDYINSDKADSEYANPDEIASQYANTLRENV